jgi:hypothetical protein
MKTIHLLGFLVAVVALAVPSAASAKPRGQYPMKAKDFETLIEARIKRVKEAVDLKLEKNGVSDARKKEILKTLDEVAKPVRAQLRRATADGTVTRAEGEMLESLAAGLRGKMRARLKSDKRTKATAPAPKKAQSKKASAGTTPPTSHDEPYGG